MYRINRQYTAVLLKQKEKIFHTRDLAVLWGISNNNTLYTTIKRYCKNGVLYGIFKGLYSVIPPQEIDPIVLGLKAIHGFAYVSMETVLQQYGIINQVIPVISFVGEKSKTFEVLSHQYKSRQMKEEYLYNPAGIEEKGNVKMATPIRAIADMLYFNSQAAFDKAVDWMAVKKMQKSIGYPLTPNRYVDTTS